MLTDLGALGVVAGITFNEGLDVAESPSEFLAATRKEYERPLTSPVIVHGEDEQVWVPVAQETLYPEIADPLSAGLSHRRFTLLLALVTVMLVGESGVVAGITFSDGLESDDTPISFRALT